MLTYMERDMSRMMMRGSSAVRRTRPRKQRRARFEEERKKREAEGPAAADGRVPPGSSPTTRRWTACSCPHRFTLQVGDKPSQEWEIKKYKINPTLDPEQFKRKTRN